MSTEYMLRWPFMVAINVHLMHVKLTIKVHCCEQSESKETARGQGQFNFLSDGGH